MELIPDWIYSQRAAVLRGIKAELLDLISSGQSALDIDEYIMRPYINNTTALHHAVVEDNTDLIQLLLSSVSQENRDKLIMITTEEHQYTALHMCETKSTIQLLLEHCSSPKVRDEFIFMQNEEGNTVFHFVAVDGDAEGLELLLAQFSEKNRLKLIFAKNNELRTSLHFACQNSKQLPSSQAKTTAEFLLEQCFTQEVKEELIFMCDVWGYTALHIAALVANTKAVELLLHHVSEASRARLVFHQSRDGETSLHLTAAVTEMGRHRDAMLKADIAKQLLNSVTQTQICLLTYEKENTGRADKGMHVISHADQLNNIDPNTIVLLSERNLVELMTNSQEHHQSILHSLVQLLRNTKHLWNGNRTFHAQLQVFSRSETTDQTIVHSCVMELDRYSICHHNYNPVMQSDKGTVAGLLFNAGTWHDLRQRVNTEAQSVLTTDLSLDLIRMLNTEDQTALHYAAGLDQGEMLAVMLSYIKQPKDSLVALLSDHRGATALHCAGSPQTAEVLLNSASSDEVLYEMVTKLDRSGNCAAMTSIPAASCKILERSSQEARSLQLSCVNKYGQNILSAHVLSVYLYLRKFHNLIRSDYMKSLGDIVDLFMDDETASAMISKQDVFGHTSVYYSLIRGGKPVDLVRRIRNGNLRKQALAKIIMQVPELLETGYANFCIIDMACMLACYVTEEDFHWLRFFDGDYPEVLAYAFSYEIPQRVLHHTKFRLNSSEFGSARKGGLTVLLNQKQIDVDLQRAVLDYQDAGAVCIVACDIDLTVCNQGCYSTQLNSLNKVIEEVKGPMNMPTVPTVLYYQVRCGSDDLEQAVWLLGMSELPPDFCVIAAVTYQDYRQRLVNRIKKMSHSLNTSLLEFWFWMRQNPRVPHLLPLNSSFTRKALNVCPTSTTVLCDADSELSYKDGCALILYSTKSRMNSQLEYQDIYTVLREHVGFPQEQIVTRADPTKDELLASVKDFLSSANKMKKYVIISTMFHYSKDMSGDLDQDAIFVEGGIVTMDDLVNLMSPYKSLFKILLMQCCRGEAIENRLYYNEKELNYIRLNRSDTTGHNAANKHQLLDGGPNKEKTKPVYLPENTVVYFSTLPGLRAKRGLWFKEMRRHMEEITATSQTPVQVYLDEMMTSVATEIRELTFLVQHVNSLWNIRQRLTLLIHPAKNSSTEESPTEN